MRIAHVIETLGRGGAERLLVSTLQNLDPSRFQTSVATLFGPNPLAPELRAHGIPVEELHLRGGRDLLPGLRALGSVLREISPDVVHTHLYFANVLGRLAAPRHCRVVTTLHNPDYGFEDTGTARFRMKKEMDRVTGHWRNDAFIAVSEAVRRDYARQMGFSPIRVLHNFLVLEEFDAGLRSVDRQTAREELGVGPEEVLLLHVGRHHVQKGLDLLLEALFELRRNGVGAVFRQAGGGPLTPVLRARASALGLEEAVQWLGVRGDVERLYRAADLFVFPSRYEAFGLSLLEAMAAGVPCVASSAGGIEEVVGSTGARLVPVGDALSLFETLLQLCRDRDSRAALGAAGRARAIVFDARDRIPRLEAFYAAL